MGRKRKTKVKAEEITQSFEGWSVGDLAWGIRPNKQICRGTIIRFIESERLAQILCMEGNGYLICEIDTLVETSSKSIMKKRAKEYLTPSER